MFEIALHNTPLQLCVRRYYTTRPRDRGRQANVNMSNDGPYPKYEHRSCAYNLRYFQESVTSFVSLKFLSVTSLNCRHNTCLMTGRRPSNLLTSLPRYGTPLEYNKPLITTSGHKRENWRLQHRPLPGWGVTQLVSDVQYNASYGAGAARS